MMESTISQRMKLFLLGMVLLWVITSCQTDHAVNSIELIELPESSPFVDAQHPSETPTHLPPSLTPALLLPKLTPTFSPPTSTPTLTTTPEPVVTPHAGIRALLLIPDQYGANYYLFRDNLEWLGWDITTAGINTFSEPCSPFARVHGSGNVEVDYKSADLVDVDPLEYDVLALMPASQFSFVGAPYNEILTNQDAMDLIHNADEYGWALYAPCTGVRVLAAAGILNGHTVTGKGTYAQAYRDAGAIYLPEPNPPVIDGNLVTAVRGLYYHHQSAEAVATALENIHKKSPPPPFALPESFKTEEISVEGTTWSQTIGGAYADGGRSLVQTPDGGYLLAGYTFSMGEGYSDAVLIKSDAGGNQIWAKTYGGIGMEYANSVAVTQDGGYILTGYTTSQGAGSKDIYVVKTDSQGNQLWSTTLGGEGVDVGMGILQTGNGDYLVTGYTESYGAGESDIYVVRIDPNGKEIWSQTYGGSGPDLGNSIDQAQDGGFIIGGASGSFTSNSDVVLLKIDSSGVQSWLKNYSNPVSHLDFDWGNGVQSTSDGGYILVGESDREDDLMAIFLLKTDNGGNVAWTQVLGRKFYDYGSDVTQVSDGGYLITGATKNGSTGKNDLYLAKIDVDGNLVWEEKFGTPKGSEWGASIIETLDGGWAVLGYTDSFGAGSFEFWLLRGTDPLHEEKVEQPSDPQAVCTAAGLPEKACTGVGMNSEWSPIFQEFNQVEMALVPAGCFTMGNDGSLVKEAPTHPMCIEQPFWIDRTEVTVEQYVRFMNATSAGIEDQLVWDNGAGKSFVQMTRENGMWIPTPGDSSRPLEAVSYQKAVEYCAWREARLMIEPEWEFAARGPDNLLYPWGNDFIPENVVRIYDKVPPAGSKPQGASWVGALDMSSSLHEWVSSIFKSYPYDPLDGREAPLEQDNSSERVLRGGSWYHGDGMRDNVTTTGRLVIPPWYVAWPFGIRCARSIDL